MKVIFMLILVASLAFACGGSGADSAASDSLAPGQNNVATDAAAPQKMLETVAFATYCNGRYNYCIDYPEEILTGQGESDNGDGQVFASEDRSRTITVWGEMNILEESLEDRMNDVLANSMADAEISIKTLTENSFTIAGVRNGKGVYQKSILIEDGFATFILEYPADKEHNCNMVAERVAKSFTMGESQ